jgi:heme/copper-type cytochrome/quinol oxidase subunit 3
MHNFQEQPALRHSVPWGSTEARTSARHDVSLQAADRGRVHRAASTPDVGAVNNGMIRPVFTEIALFLTPFAVYVVYLWAPRADLLHPDTWPLRTLLTLTCVALALMLGSFLVLAHFSGEPKNSTYVPAHVEDGKLVPGMAK